MTIDKLILEFLEYMEIEKGRAIASTRNYHHYLTQFSQFAHQKAVENPEKIDLELVRQFRLYLNRNHHQGQPISKNTQNYYLIALRSFLKYLSKKDIQTLPPEKIELAKTEERQITFLKEEELDEILSQPDLKTLAGLRDRAILDLLFSTGLRVSELCNLKKEDINLKKSEFSVSGKGGKIRVVFLDHQAKNSLSHYLSRRLDHSEYLFLSYGRKKTDSENLKPKKPITPRSVQRMIKKYALAAGLTKKVSPHTLRHSFATDLLVSGADLRSVQSLLGHASITTTQIYTHLTDRHLAEVHQAFHGLRRADKENQEKKEPGE